ncbi:hypothetical protein DK872_05220 [Kosakonia sp. MH5]|nr:hypothetical protein [Kosakonia sp. MH5]
MIATIDDYGISRKQERAIAYFIREIFYSILNQIDMRNIFMIVQIHVQEFIKEARWFLLTRQYYRPVSGNIIC